MRKGSYIILSEVDFNLNLRSLSREDSTVIINHMLHVGWK